MRKLLIQKRLLPDLALFLAVTTFCFLLLVSQNIWDVTKFYIFQSRDIYRADLLIHGQPIFFGPEATGGGNLLGPLYYFLLALPRVLGFGVRGIWYWMIFLCALGGSSGWWFFRSRLGSGSGVIWLIAYSSAISTSFVLSMFLNVSFLFLFVTLALISIVNGFCDSDVRRRQFSSILACFAVGLGIQLHFSLIAFFGAFVFLQIGAPRLGLPRLGARWFLASLLAFLLPLTPYLIWRAASHFGLGFGQPAPYVGRVEAAIPTLAHFFVRGFSQSVNYGTLVWNAKKLLFIFPLALGALLAVVLVCRILDIFDRAQENFRNSDARQTHSRRCLRTVAICALFGLIPFSYYFVVPIGARYGLPLGHSLIAMMVTLHAVVSSKKGIHLTIGNGLIGFCLVLFCVCYGKAIFYDLSYRTLQYVTVVISFIVFCIFVDRIKFKSGWGNPLGLCLTVLLIVLQSKLPMREWAPYSQKSVPTVTDWKYIWTKISTETGWTYQEAVGRIFFLSHHMEQDSLLALSVVASNLPSQRRKYGKTPDGYFVAVGKWPGIEALPWMLRQRLQSEVSEGLRNGDIQLGEYDRTQRNLVIPYWIKNPESLPIKLSNSSLGYLESKDQPVLDLYTSSQPISKIGERQFAFLWNECPDQNRYCRAGAVVQLTHLKSDRLELEVEVIGAPLSQQSPYVSPGWTQNWLYPYVEVQCGKLKQRRQIASSIGFNRRYDEIDSNFNFTFGNNSFIAPFKRRFQIDCVEPLNEISIGRLGSEVEQLTSVLRLPEQKLTYHDLED